MAIATSHRFTDGDLPVEAGRYRLVASGSCPWCRRVLIARRLLGLTEAIAVSWTYGRGADGYWELTGADGAPGTDPVLKARSLAEVYATTPGYTPPPTIPALVDMTTGRVVSDDSGALLFVAASPRGRPRALPGQPAQLHRRLGRLAHRARQQPARGRHPLQE